MEAMDIDKDEGIEKPDTKFIIDMSAIESIEKHKQVNFLQDLIIDFYIILLDLLIKLKIRYILIYYLKAVELQSLEISVFDQTTFEKGVIQQVGKALTGDADHFFKTKQCNSDDLEE